MFVIWIYELENCFFGCMILFWLFFDLFLAYFVDFVYFFSADVAIINSYYFFKKKPLKIQFLKKQILHTFMFVLINYYWLKISWFVFCGKQWKIIRNNFHWKIISIYENYIIVLLFFMILLRRCGRKTISKHTKNK